MQIKLKPGHRRNAIVMGVVVGMFWVYDLWASVNKQATLSNSVLFSAHFHPFWPFFFGVMATHLFIRWSEPNRQLEKFAYISLGVMALLNILKIFFFPELVINPVYPLIAGAIAGLCWQQG